MCDCRWDFPPEKQSCYDAAGAGVAGAGVTDSANILDLASAPRHNAPVASAVAADSAVADAIAAVGVP
jgi:hypothetical protein